MDLAWLDDLPPFGTGELSPEAEAGLRVAQEIRAGITTIELSAYHHHPSTVRRWIHKAHHELTTPPRPCKECLRLLPRGSRQSRRYCDEHASAASRVRRHRRMRRESI